MAKLAKEAIVQIDNGKYWHEVRASLLPLYKVGVACYGHQCVVTAVLHE
jgi:hypothetical protein